MAAAIRPERTRRPALAAVLAGGAGRRLGGAKAAVLLRGRPLAAYPVAAAQAAGLQVALIAKAHSALPQLGCEIVCEPDLPRHPLCGIVTALAHARSPVLALGCDMPFLDSGLVGWMARLDGPAVAMPAGRPQPMLARWVPEQLPALRDGLRRQAAIGDLLAELAPRAVDERELSRFGDPALLLFNVNDRADLARAELLARSLG